METKYTTDGKKVVIIGSLNAKETIVQEIFITEKGDEIPSGENFVVKSLYDEPVESWKEIERERCNNFIQEAEIRMKRAKQRAEEAESAYRKLVDIFRLKAKVIRSEIDELAVDIFDRVVNFISGNYNYYVTVHYGRPEIYDKKAFEQGLSVGFDKHTVESHKMITFMGCFRDEVYGFKSRLSEYSCGSDSVEILPFFSKEDALKYCVEIIESRKDYDPEKLEFLREHGLPIDEKKYKLHMDNRKKSIQKDIDDDKHSLEENMKKLEGLDK